MSTTPSYDEAITRQRLGATVPWELRQRFIRTSQELALTLHRVDDAAQVGTDLPFDLDGRLEAFLAARRTYDEAVATSRG